MASNQIIFNIEDSQSDLFQGSGNSVILTPLYDVLDNGYFVNFDPQQLTASSPGSVVFNNVPANYYSASIRTPYTEVDYIILVPSGLTGTVNATTLLYSASLAFPPSQSVYSSVSSSYALTSSYALNGGGGGTTLTTGSTYPITSSWAITASYAKTAVQFTGSSIQLWDAGLSEYVTVYCNMGQLYIQT